MPVTLGAQQRGIAHARQAALAAALLLFSCVARAQAAAAEPEIVLQYRTCTVTTTTPIYEEGRSAACGIESTQRYSDSSCPVARYNACKDASHGVAQWVDATSNEGRRPGPRRDGEGDNASCLQEGEAWVARANQGQIGGVEKPREGTRYQLRSISRHSDDTRDPIFGNRVKAWHQCTYVYGIYRATYYTSRSPACGVEARTECRVNTTYNTCRHESFGVEDFVKVDRRDASCGLFLGEGRSGIIQNGQVTVPPKSFSILEADVRRPALCTNKTGGDRYFCLVQNMVAAFYAQSVDKEKAEPIRVAIAEAVPGALLDAIGTGDMRQALDGIHDIYLADRSLGLKENLNPNFHEDIRNFVSRLPDDRYFALTARLARQALTASPVSGKGPIFYFNPLWNLMSKMDPGKRRVPFSAIADLQVLLNGASIQSSANLRGQALVISDFYTRLTAAYVHRRAFDILQLQALSARLDGGATSVASAADEASNQVRTMKLRPEVESAALQAIAARTSTDQFKPILQDVINTARDDIRISLEGAEAATERLVAIDPIFKASMANLHLVQKQYHHASLAMREAAVAAHQLPKDAAEESRAANSLVNFQRNFNGEVRASLDKAKAVVQRIQDSSTQTLTLDTLGISDDQIALSFPLMDALQKLNMTVGKSFEGVRFQVINQISVALLGPLQTAASDLQ